MTQDVRPWLGEIQRLQEKLAAAHRERDEAYASASNWRRVYETEANQRRTEANLAQQAIANLQAKLQQMQTLPTTAESNGTALLDQLQQEIEPLQHPENLKAALLKALMECDRVARLLQAEQAAHTQTRQTLTAALGDTMQMLSKERSRHCPSPAATATQAPTKRSANDSGNGSSRAASTSTAPVETKIPLLELPPIE
jgi:chromosome segregation ATPase